MDKEDYLYQDLTYEIIGACMEVHKTLGCGFLEAVYQEALEFELKSRGIPYEREKRIKIHYKERILDKEYVADFLCYDKIILEIKALSEITGDHEAQVLNYLKATNLKLGLLANFGTRSLQHRRLIL